MTDRDRRVRVRDDRGPNRLRLFLAVQAPESWHDWLGRLQHELDGAIPGYFRWTAPESWHLTVLFLGSQEPDRLPDISNALRAAASQMAAPTLIPGELGAPRPLDRPRLVWQRVDEGGVLAAANRRLSQHLAAAGIDFDAKPFLGHITLGRARRPAPIDFRNAVNDAARRAAPAPGPELAPGLILYRSHLEPTGARYEAIDEAGFQE